MAARKTGQQVQHITGKQQRQQQRQQKIQKQPVVAIGLPLPGMKPALEFLAENSGSFLMILIL